MCCINYIILHGMVLFFIINIFEIKNRVNFIYAHFLRYLFMILI